MQTPLILFCCVDGMLPMMRPVSCSICSNSTHGICSPERGSYFSLRLLASQRTDMVLSAMSRCSRTYQMQQKAHLFYTSDQESRNSYMTDEIPCNSGKSLLLQGILLLDHTGMRSEKRPQVTVLKSARSCAFRASMSRGELHNLAIC